MPSNHRIIRSAEITLPRASGDRDITEEFDAPGQDDERIAQNRPYLSYRVAANDDRPVRLVLELNGTAIVDRTLSGPVSSTFNQVFEHGLLRPYGNEMRFFAPNDEPGRVSVSHVILVYSAYDERSYGTHTPSPPL